MIQNRKVSMISQRVRTLMCALFGVFLFLYFYLLESPVLELAQLQLSEGKTTFHPLASAVILSCVLVMLQRLVCRWVVFSDFLHFLSYLPSVVLAVLSTAFTPAIDWIAIVFVAFALLFFILGIFLNRKIGVPSFHEETSSVKVLATQSVGMVCVCCGLGIFSNSNDIITFETKAAHYINEKNYEQALNIGNRSLAVSSRLTALRAYAMACSEKGMGDSFFSFPLSSTGAEQLLFSSQDTLKQLLPPDSLYVKIGGWRSEKESAIDFLRRMVLRNGTNFTREYYLTGLLLEKDVKAFVHELQVLVHPGDSICFPKNYKEALCLYAAETGTAVLGADSANIKNYKDFVAEAGLYSNDIIRSNKLRRKYGDTYWWYYHYQH